MIIENIEQLRKWIEENGIKHFKAEEFICKHCGKLKIDTDLILKLEDIRTQIGKPIFITSAYRCPEYNKQVGGVPDSAHTKGLAVDIACTNSRDRYEILDIVFKFDLFNRIGIGKSFIHLDIDKEKPQNVVWHYYNKER